MSERLSGTVTFLFTDIERSTALLKSLGRETYGELLTRWKTLLREAFAAHRGDEVDNQGDQFFVAFRSARDALLAAVAIQRSLSDHEWPEDAEVLVRVGIHSGEAAAAAERYVGISVHRAARIGAVAHGGQVLVSDSTRTLMEDDLPEGLFLRDLGLWRLEDIDRPGRIWQVAAEGLKREFPPLRGAERVKQPAARRRLVLAAALVGVIAAAVAIPLFALGGGGGSSGSVSTVHVDANSLGVIDASSGRLLASSPVVPAPESVATGATSVWVTNPTTDTVSRIDPKTNARAGAVPVGNDPTGVAVGGGFVWVTNGLSGDVSKIDPNANGGSGQVVDTIPAGVGPSGVAFASGRLWVANAIDRTVMEFVPDSHTPLRTIGVAGGADELAAGLGFVWVVSGSASSVTPIEARSGTPLPAIAVGNDPTAISVGAGSIWVANGLDGTVSKIDPSTSTASPPIPVGGNLAGVAAGNGAVWVSDSHAGTLSRIDATADKIVQTVRTTNPPGGVAIAAGRLYVGVGAPASAHRGGTLTVQGPPFDSIDPAVAYQTPGSWSALISTNDGLVTFQRVGGANGIRVVPDLATSLPTATDGGRTYTFKVRPGIHYSTGPLVQPADFRRAIERALAYPNGAGGYLTGIVGAGLCVSKPKQCDLRRGIAIDPIAGTVAFHLTAPDPDFLEKLALPAADAVPANTPLHARLPLPATGPYRIGHVVKTKVISRDPKTKKTTASSVLSRVTLVRNPHFQEWSPAAQPDGYPDTIVYESAGSNSAQVNAVKRKTADYATVDPSATAALRRGGYSNQLHENPTFTTFFFFLNTRMSPFNRVGVRRAINFALDRNRLARLAEAGFGVPEQPNCQVLPPNSAGFARFCPYPLDLARARRLVAASGTAGQTVIVPTGPPGARQSTYLVSVLRSLGYTARLRKFPSAGAYENAQRKGKFQVGPAGWTADFPAPSNFFVPLLTCAAVGSNNAAAFCDPSIDRKIRRAGELEVSDPQSAIALWSTIDRDVMRQAPWAPYANGGQIGLVTRRVGNYQNSLQWGPLFDQMWVR